MKPLLFICCIQVREPQNYCMGGEGFHLLQIAGWPVFQAKPGGQPAIGTVMKMRLICMRTDPAGKHQQQMLRKPRPHCKLQGQ